jgi:hypothetical protein
VNRPSGSALNRQVEADFLAELNVKFHLLVSVLNRQHPGVV